MCVCVYVRACVCMFAGEEERRQVFFECDALQRAFFVHLISLDSFCESASSQGDSDTVLDGTNAAAKHLKQTSVTKIKGIKLGN